MKNVVVIGGGSGVASILSGIKNIDGISIKAIITVSDDGGSTGRLKSKYGIPAVGDVRNVLVSLAESETLLKDLMDFRFLGDSNVGEDVDGHSLGNLILASLTQTTGDLMQAIKTLEKIMRIKGSIIPSTISVVDLFAKMKDGTIVAGETNIREVDMEISEVFFNQNVFATKEAISAVLEADYIILGIGSLYTSILPNLVIEGLREAVNESSAELIYLSNIMSEKGETDNYDVSDHIAAIEKHLRGRVDTIVYPNNIIPEKVLEPYRLEGSKIVKLNRKELSSDYNIEEVDLLNFNGNQARHDSEKIKKWFKDKVVK